MTFPNWIYKAYKILFIAIWMYILFLMTINFLNEINEIIRIFFIYSLFFIVIFRHKITFNLELVILLLFGTAYYFMYTRYNHNLDWTYIRLWLGAPALYFVGKSFVSEKTEKYFMWIILLFSFGLFLYGLLGMLHYSTGNPLNAVTIDIWSGDPINATLSGVYYTAIGSLFVFFLINTNYRKQWYLTVLYLIVFSFSVYYSIKLGNRTFFVITGIVIIVTAVSNLLIYKAKNALKLVIIPAIFIGVYLVYRYNLFGLQDYVVSTRWFIKMSSTIENGLLIDPRFKVYGLVGDQIFSYKFGGYQMDLGGLGYAHNMWMDALYTAGIYPFFLLISYTALTLTTTYRITRSKYISPNIKILVISIFFGMNLHFMVEPILDGVPYLFSMFCLINGLTYQYLVTKNKARIPIVN